MITVACPPHSAVRSPGLVRGESVMGPGAAREVVRSITSRRICGRCRLAQLRGRGHGDDAVGVVTAGTAAIPVDEVRRHRDAMAENRWPMIRARTGAGGRAEL